MVKAKPGTQLHGVPPPDEMRAAREELRREVREASELDAHEALYSAAPRRERATWGVAVVDAELPSPKLALDYAALRDHLTNIKRARAQKPRNGRPTKTQDLIEIVDELDRASISLRVWKGSIAHKRIIERFRFPDDASLGTKDGAAFSLLRKLGNIARRCGVTCVADP